SESELRESPQGLLLRHAQQQLTEYLDGTRKEFSLTLDLRGSEFQLKVWQELLKIPYGETRSYKDIAKILQSPQACRAVGTANGKNPISLIIPCHRVINSGGGLGGYAGGVQTKTALLQLETAHSK
ncbi:MAG: methylated-DNA--[protein]-cysteine S-methyltransferase, partial [Bdellovibrio sp.]|nr:methylated-DNA--[protein]-cysteine S-methyltransferase [Bdellovibrio sp.]